MSIHYREGDSQLKMKGKSIFGTLKLVHYSEIIYQSGGGGGPMVH